MSAIFLRGSALSVLQGIPDNFFHCAVTSPPYFGLRKYEGGEEVWDGEGGCEHEWVTVVKRDKRGVEGSNLVGRNPYTRGEARVDKIHGSCTECNAWRGQLGGEPTPELYIQHLIQIMREVRRVLRLDGVFWLNIGDSWAGGKGQSGQGSPAYQAARQDVSLNKPYHHIAGPKQTRVLDDRAILRRSGIKPLDMVLIPSMLALAARADGWFVRSTVVWDKRNPMPESVNGWRWEKHRVKVSNRTRGSNEGSMPLQSHHPGQVPHRDGSFGSGFGADSCQYNRSWA